MKTQFRACIGLLAVILVLISDSCKKHSIEKKYTGNFDFTIQEHSWRLNHGTYDTTYTYSGNITVWKVVRNGLSEADVYLKIVYSYPNGYKTMAVDKKGRFSSPGIDGGFNGEDQLDFVYATTGLSASFRQTVHGVRR